MGITGVNEHVEPVVNAVLPSAVIKQRIQNNEVLWTVWINTTYPRVLWVGVEFT